MKIIADTVNLEDKIYNRSFTVGWLLDSLRTNDECYRKLHGNRAVRDVKCEDVSGGKGFVSVVVRCVLTFVDSEDENDTYSTIMKIPGFESLEEVAEKTNTENLFAEEHRETITKIHKLECEFYSELAPILDAPIPRVYKMVDWIYQKQEGCLHMEDMTLKGKTISYFDNVNLTQVKCVIRHLAHMHKNILSADEAMWKGKHQPEMEEAFKNGIAVMDQMGRKFGEKTALWPVLEPLLDKHNDLRMSLEFFLYMTKDAFKELNIPSVIVHGDMHSGNIMWAIDSNGDVQNEVAAFVDWQIIHEGNPMEDLARFLALCADGVVRRQAEAFAIDYYLECLTKEFGNDPSKVPYTKEQLQRAYNIVFVCQGAFALGIVAFFTSTLGDQTSLVNACKDFGTLKALHTYEDCAKLFDGDLKDIVAKFKTEQ